MRCHLGDAYPQIGRQIDPNRPPPRAAHCYRDRTFLIVALTVSCLLSPTPYAYSECAKLPAAIPDRIGRVQLFLENVTDKSVLKGKYDIVWSDYFYKPGWQKVAGIYSMKYMMAARDPNPHAQIANHGSAGVFTERRDLHWYHLNHPDWVMYKCPGAPEPPLCARTPTGNGPDNPAYSCYFSNSPDYVPLDVSNPEVREFLLTANLGGPPDAGPVIGYPGKGSVPVTFASVLRSGLYDAVAVDNLGAENAFGACGIYRGDSFVRKYSGAKIDLRYLADEVNWMKWLRQRVAAAGLCLAGNDYFDTNDRQGFLQIAETLDIVLEEHGFTRDSGPLETGSAWKTRIETFRYLTDTSKPLIIVDYLTLPSGDPLTHRGAALLSWSIANYLLIKGDRTYLAIATPDAGGDPASMVPQLFANIGRPQEAMQTDGVLYWRHFEHALAIVNPSPETGHLDFAETAWRSLDGRALSGWLEVAPASALVLFADAP